jgi:hypothetical protein
MESGLSDPGYWADIRVLVVAHVHATLLRLIRGPRRLIGGGMMMIFGGRKAFSGRNVFHQAELTNSDMLSQKRVRPESS